MFRYVDYSTDRRELCQVTPATFLVIRKPLTISKESYGKFMNLRRQQNQLSSTMVLVNPSRIHSLSVPTLIMTNRLYIRGNPYEQALLASKNPFICYGNFICLPPPPFDLP